jgi:hypothetical protein
VSDANGVGPSHSTNALPAWVVKRSGRLEPFEPDKICGSIFAAAESAGLADAFLARELTDGVLHFLRADPPSPLTTADLAELIAKVVRELGQPLIARQYVRFAQERQRQALPAGEPLVPQDSLAEWLARVGRQTSALALAWQTAGRTLRAHSLQHHLPRELVAAHRDGLLSIAPLDTPLELLSCVLILPSLGRPPFCDRPATELVESILAVRDVAGHSVVLDSPEYTLAECPGSTAELVEQFVHELALGLRSAGLAAVINLNCATAPAWAQARHEGPLFAGLARPPDHDRLQALSVDLAVRCLRHNASLEPAAVAAEQPARPPVGHIRVIWHLGAAQLRRTGVGLPLAVWRAARSFGGLEVVFDRPGQPVRLAAGIDRRTPAALASVTMHLDRIDAQRLDKVASLTRLARSVGHFRQEYLRRHGRPALERGFLVERARLVMQVASTTPLQPETLAHIRQVLGEDRWRVLDAVLELPLEVAWGDWPEPPTEPTHLQLLRLLRQAYRRQLVGLSFAGGDTNARQLQVPWRAEVGSD